MFRSFFQAGFECSTHKNRDGKRLDLLATTCHDQLAARDYRMLRKLDIRSIRIAARWHLIEDAAGNYDFSSLRYILRAATETETEILLDLLHFGWPDHLDILSPDFIDSFRRFTQATVAFLREENFPYRMFAPVNEISFLAWAGGDVAQLNPHTIGRGAELKRILVRAALVASDVLLQEVPGVRLISPEPVINIVGDPDIPGDEIEARNYTLAQYEAWDMLSGRLAPELGGRPEYLDVIGINYYARNQWVHNSEPMPRTDPRFRPFHHMLRDVWERYGRPMFIAETGTEDAARADWFGYICDEVATAIRIGIPVHGVCLYPIVNHPGWDDDRYCQNGLFDYADGAGNREVHAPLAHAILNQRHRFSQLQNSSNDSKQHRSDLLFSPSLGLRISEAATSNESLRPESESVLF